MFCAFEPAAAPVAVVLAPGEPILIDYIQPVKRKGKAKAAIFDALKNDFFIYNSLEKFTKL